MLPLKLKFIVLLLAYALGFIIPIAVKGEDQITLGEPKFDELFAAQYKYYEKNSAGYIGVNNNTDRVLLVETKVTIPEYAPNPVISKTPLPAKQTTQAPLKIGFDSVRLEFDTEFLTLNAQLEVIVHLGNEQLLRRQIAARIKLNNIHIFPSVLPEAPALFVDPGDPSVAKFTQQIKSNSPRDNQETAQSLFEYMQKANIICMKQTGRKVWYPGEMLSRRIGGSYDCALLYAALLEGCKIPVALMASPEYILILFENDEKALKSKQMESIIWKNKNWMPVDIRMLKFTFSEANKEGMREYKELEKGDKIIPVVLREAWKLYKPIKYITPQANSEIQLGITYVQRGDLDKAEETFKKLMDGSASAAANNNIGNISFLKGNAENAINYYQKSLQIDPGDGAIYLNLGIAYAQAGMNNDSNRMLDQALAELGNYARMCHELGLKLDGTDCKEIRELLLEAEKRASDSRTRPLGVRAIPDSEKLPLYWKRR